MSRFRVLPIAVGLILVGLATVAVYLSIGVRVRRPSSEWGGRFNAPESVEQTRAFLAKVESRIRALPSTQGQSHEMEMLSAAVYRRAIEHPELPEVWKTAAAVINRQSRHDMGTITAVCGEDSSAIPQIGHRDKLENVAFTTYQNCAISLDDDGRAIKNNRQSAARSSIANLLQLKDVRVTYRGGALLPVTTLSCLECTFEIDLQGIPPPRGKSLIRGLLMTYSDNFAINISSN
jgi:hypothetical protein